MWIDAASMRETLRAALPERAFLRRDRGDALLITNAPIFDPEIREIPGFTLEKRGTLLHIFPDESWVSRLENAHPIPPDHFCGTLLRFRGEGANRENLLLFTLGLKLLDAGSSASEAEISAYERALRQRCALALRGGCGGALYAASIILHQINNLYKGENAQ